MFERVTLCRGARRLSRSGRRHCEKTGDLCRRRLRCPCLCLCVNGSGALDGGEGEEGGSQEEKRRGCAREEAEFEYSPAGHLQPAAQEAWATHPGVGDAWRRCVGALWERPAQPLEVIMSAMALASSAAPAGSYPDIRAHESIGNLMSGPSPVSAAQV